MTTMINHCEYIRTFELDVRFIEGKTHRFGFDLHTEKS